jgi:hypothetical protein
MLPGEGVARMKDLTVGTLGSRVPPGAVVTPQSVGWPGNLAIEVAFEDIGGRLDRKPVFRDDEQQLDIVTPGRPWSFEGDGRLFSLKRRRIKRADLNWWINAQPRGGDGGRDGD